jgi:hypothetical protein
MSESKKEEKKEEKSEELMKAEAMAEESKKQAEEVSKCLKKHNCTLDGQIEMHEGKVSCQVMYIAHVVAGEEEEERKKRAEAARDELQESLKEMGCKLSCSAVLRSSGAPQFVFRFDKLEEEKK